MTLLCYDTNRDLYNHIKEIFLKYKDIEGNPFINYAVLSNDIKYEDFDYRFHGIKTPSNSDKAPVVKKLRYYKWVAMKSNDLKKIYNRKTEWRNVVKPEGAEVKGFDNRKLAELWLKEKPKKKK